MWTISFLRITGARPAAFITIASLSNLVSVAAQWLCSAVVLIKIREVREKISKNKLNVNSANRFRKQARLTFQFFYPSIFCTVSSLVYFAKPFLIGSLAEWQFILLHAMQSRDFEQLCEFMMRVNPLYDSSEGWQESSDDEERQSAAQAYPICTGNNRNQEPSHLVQEPHSIVLDLGRQTVEHWAHFAKKASI
uniref:G protein-coupled receptor n=1 Tax=Parascaris univalens TaxID=6257 RepID=A0A914ZE92_PARUN